MPSVVADTNATFVAPPLTRQRTDTVTDPVSASIEHPSPVHFTGSTFDAIDIAGVIVTVGVASTVQPPLVHVVAAPVYVPEVVAPSVTVE